jgi:hypothetical protein
MKIESSKSVRSLIVLTEGREKRERGSKLKKNLIFFFNMDGLYRH